MLVLSQQGCLSVPGFACLTAQQVESTAEEGGGQQIMAIWIFCCLEQLMNIACDDSLLPTASHALM